MTKLKLCNVHKLTLANEGEERKPIHIPFGTWAYDDTLDQTLDREHAEKIAGDLKEMVDKGEPGIPVYQGHPDVPEYAGKYPDKGALGWVKTITVNEDGMDLAVEWDRDPGKGFGWFSPYWVGDTPTVGPDGKRNCIIDGLNSIGLVNNPNIREFRLANEMPEELPTTKDAPKLPPFLVELAGRFDKRKAGFANETNYDESKHPRSEDGKWTSGGGGSGGGASGNPKSWDAPAKEKLKLMLKSEAVSIDKGGRPTKDDVVFEYNHKMYYVGKDSEHMVKDFADRGLVKRIRGYHNIGSKPADPLRRESGNVFHLRDREAMHRLAAELAARFDARKNK